MKPKMRRNLYKEITTTKSRYLAIMAIVMLGVGFYAGLKATSPVMKHTADHYYDTHNLMDIRLLSTMGFTEEDVLAVKQQQDLEEVWATYSLDILMASEGGQQNVARLHALPRGARDGHGINLPMIIEGRLPDRSGECLIDIAYGAAVGDTVRVSEANDQETLDMLKKYEYTVTGIVKSPLYISRDKGTSRIGDGSIAYFVIIPEEDFQLDYYTEILATVKGAKALDSYSEAYDQAIDAVKERLEPIAEERETIRYNEIMDEARAELDKGRQELADARKTAEDELSAAEEELKEASAKLDDSEKEIKEGEQALADAQAKLNREKKAFDTQILDAKKQLDEAEAQITKGYEEDEAGYAAFLAGRAYMTPEEAAAFEAALTQTRLQLEGAKNELESRKQAYESGKTKAESEFKAAQAEIDKNRRELEEGRKALNEGRAELEKGRKEYEEQKAKAYKELTDAEEELSEAEAEVARIKKPEWYVLGRDTNVGFMSFSSDTDRIDAISRVFPAFFFLVAALVCLTTMTRMVEEQRTQIGILKALGYGKGAIAAKYLIYAGSASLLGSAAGLVLGFITFPSVIYQAYGILYYAPPVRLEFNVAYALISSGIAILCTMLATLWACYHELASFPAELIRPKAPAPGRRVLLERIPLIWNHFSFLKKVTARNLFRYKKRFFMTIIGVGGCTALLLTGFGLRDSIMGIVSIHFGDVHTYDMVVSLENNSSANEDSEINRLLPELGNESLYIMASSVEASGRDETLTAYLWVPEKSEDLNGFVRFRERESHEAVAFPQPGRVVISEKLSTRLKVGVGDAITLSIGGTDRCEAVVGGITENYVFNYVYMTAQDYADGFGKAPEFNQILVSLGEKNELTEEDEARLSETVLKAENVAAANVTGKSRREFGKAIKGLDAVVVLIIVFANLLAFVVLYNLTNVNITERVREIATIKVLGFFDREVSGYVYRENLILTLIGGLLGLVGGIFLHRFVVVTAEVDLVMFERTIHPISYVWSILLTLVFAGVVNFVMYFRLKNISMVESLKSTE